jgi:signal peptidase
MIQMRTRFRARTVAVTLAIVAVVAAAWMLLAPRQLGGSVDYAVIHGVSMQPKLHAGDLVLIRSKPSYKVGQVVGYQSGLLHEIVLHRIIAAHNGHYLFKGDNNNFTDSYFPTQNQLIGKLWLRIPHAGAALQWLRSPGRAAILGGIIALLTIFGGGSSGARRRRRSHSRRPESGHNISLAAVHGHVTPVVLGALVVAAAVFAGLALLGFTRPGQQLVSGPSGYAQGAAYSYHASARRSTIYPGGKVGTGDPVYLTLAHQLTLALRYRFSSPFPHTVGGTIAMQARLRSGGGWTQLLAATPPHKFSGNTAKIIVPIDLTQLQAKISAFRSEADVANETFTVAVASRIVLHGIVNGQQITSTFVPQPLTFNADDQSVELAAPPATTSTVVGAPTPDPLQTTSTGTIERLQPASLSLHGLAISLRHAREIGIAGAFVALVAALAALALASRRHAHDDELETIKRRCGSWLVSVTTPLVGSSVDVASIDSLVALAEHYSSPILYEQRDDMHVFAVLEAGKLYRFKYDAEPSESTAEPPAEPAEPVAQPPESIAPPAGSPEITPAPATDWEAHGDRLPAHPTTAVRSLVF